MKYNLGDVVYWVESSIHREKSVPCPICFGQKWITLILGDKTHLKSECGYCAPGFGGPTGQIKEYSPYCKVHSGEITGVSKKDGIRYEIGYRNKPQYELYATESEADTICKELSKEVQDRAKKWKEQQFKDATKKQSWSAGYHRKQIKEAEKTIEWHKQKIQELKK